MPSQKSLSEEVKVTEGQVLEILRRLVVAIDARIIPLQDQRADFSAAIDQVLNVGLTRINDVLAPAVQRIVDLSTLGFLVAPSTSSVTLAVGSKLFVIDEGPQRDLFAPTAFVTISRVSDIATYATAQVSSYDREHGELAVIILDVHGAPGPFTDWQISSGVGISEATRTHYTGAVAARNAADADAVATAADRVQTGLDRAATHADKLAADTAATNAANSATLAATFDPLLFAKRDGSQAFTAVINGVAPAVGANNANLVTSAWVQTAIAALVNSAPAALDTLKELSDALGGDAAFSNTVLTQLGLRLRFDAAQTLTTAQREQGRTNLAAAPFDAEAFNGIQVNGSFDWDQRNAGVAVTLDNTGNNWKYGPDGWQGLTNTTNALTLKQDTGAPYGPTVNVMTLQIATGGALAAGQYILVRTRIEGYRMRRAGWGTANAQPITMLFPILATVPGTFGVSVRNSANNRSYLATAASTAITAGGVWEYKPITIPGDTSGTWLKDNGVGLDVWFCFGTGATNQGTPGTWVNSSAVGYAPTGATNFFASNSNLVSIGDYLLLPGSEAPNTLRAPFIMRPRNEELPRVQRFYYNGVPPLTGIITGASIARAHCPHPVPMRITNPSLSLITALPVYDGVSSTTMTAVAVNYTTDKVLELDGTLAASLTNGRPGHVYQGGSGNLAVIAEL